MKQNEKDLNLLVGANLKRAIKRSKWKTQEKFASAFHVETRTIGRWCNEGIDSITTIQQLADFLEISVLTLLSF